MTENIESVTEWAVQIAEGLPEKYQEVAFAELLRYRLMGRDPHSSGDAPGPPAPGFAEETERPSGSVNQLPSDHLIAGSGTRQQQVMWAVVQLADDGNEADADAIREILKTRLGITPPSKPNVSHALRALTPRYLSRAKRAEGRGYSYTPKADTAELFQDLQQGAV